MIASRAYFQQRPVYATVEMVLNFHTKLGAERLQGGAERPILGRPA